MISEGGMIDSKVSAGQHVDLEVFPIRVCGRSLPGASFASAQ